MRDTSAVHGWSRHPDDGPLFPCDECGRAWDEYRCVYCSWRAQAHTIVELQERLERLCNVGDAVAAAFWNNPPNTLLAGAELESAMLEWKTAPDAWNASRRTG